MLHCFRCERAGLYGRHPHQVAACRVADGLDQPRPVAPPPHRKLRDRLRELQGRDRQVALPYARHDGVARKPGLLRRIAEIGAFPGPGRHDSGSFARHVHAGWRPEAELNETVVQPFNIHVARQPVEVDVAGLRDGVVKVHRAMALALPVPKEAAAAGQPETPPAVDGVVGLAVAGRQRRKGQHRLDCRTGRIGPAHCPVEHGPVGIAIQIGKGAPVHAGNEIVGVKSRAADQGQHAAVVRIDRDHRAPARIHGRVSFGLKVPVYRQEQVGPRFGLQIARCVTAAARKRWLRPSRCPASRAGSPRNCPPRRSCQYGKARRTARAPGAPCLRR